MVIDSAKGNAAQNWTVGVLDCYTSMRYVAKK
jgi:hypothetical protein